MEDYDLVVRLGRSVRRPALAPCPVHTSARRYSKRGVILTTLLNQVSEKHDCIIFVLIVTATRYNALIIQVQALSFFAWIAAGYHCSVSSGDAGEVPSSVVLWTPAAAVEGVCAWQI